MEIPREFYTLSELAGEKWNLTEDKILHMAAADKIKLSVYYDEIYSEKNNTGEWVTVGNDDPYGDEIHLDDYVTFHKKYATTFLVGSDIKKFGGVLIEGGQTKDGREILFEDVTPFTRPDVLILAEEVKRVEAIYPEIMNQNVKESEPEILMHEQASGPNIKEDEGIPVDQTAMVNKTKDYMDDIVKNHQPGWKPQNGWIPFLAKWVNKNAPNSLKLTPTACKRIATIVNPDRSKGPGKTKG